MGPQGERAGVIIGVVRWCVKQEKWGRLVSALNTHGATQDILRAEGVVEFGLGCREAEQECWQAGVPTEK